MAQPEVYNRQASFSNIQAQAPADPLPGATVDSEYNAIKTTLDAILANLALLQRDDGALANATVGFDQLSEELSAGINPWEVWVTATDYAVGDTVFHGSAVYRCATAHTSGTFTTDLAATKWTLVIDFSTLTLAAAANIAFTPTGALVATDVAAALAELDTEKAALSHTHLSSAISDSTAAGRSMLAAADAAAQQALLGLGDLAFLDSVPVTEIAAELKLSGIIEPTILAASTNDWSPTGVLTASTIRVSASTAINLTGLLAGEDGSVKILENIGTSIITLSPSSALSAAANRFLLNKAYTLYPDESVTLKYDADATTPRWRLLTRPSALPRGHISGLVVTNSVGDTVNDVAISEGRARDALDTCDLIGTAMIKQLDADWAAGTAAGMRYSGAAIANTTYHLFEIGKADGTTDYFAYAGGLDPTSVLPAGFTTYRRIKSIVRRSAAIVLFTPDAGGFNRIKTPVIDANTNVLDTTVTSFTLNTIPSGLAFQTLCNVVVVAPVGGARNVYIKNPDDTNTAPSATTAPLATARAGVSSTTTGQVIATTNTSAQITARSDGADTTLIVVPLGWWDHRGRDD